MKTKIFILMLLLLGTTTVFTSCKKDKDNPLKTTAGLIVKVQMVGTTTFISGATVNLASSEANIDNKIYISSKQTSAIGGADFGQIASGIYYYDCTYSDGTNSYYGKALVQVFAGFDVNEVLSIM